MFEWDEVTNKLSMKASRSEPWLIEPTLSHPENTWRYCTACHDRWSNNAKTNHPHLTFRDKASQAAASNPSS